MSIDGHDVLVFTSKSPPDSAAREQVAPNLLVRRFEIAFGSHPPYYFMPALLKMAASSEFRSVDVVHSVGYYFFGTVFAHALAKAHGVPHITTPVYTLNPSNWQRRWFDEIAGRRLVRNADHVIPQSEHELQLMRADGFCRRIEHDRSFRRGFGVFRTGPRCRGSAHASATSPATKECCCSSARSCRRKARSIRWRSWRGCVRRAGKLRLIMIGDVHDREREIFAARIRALELGAALTLLGAVTRST